MSRTLRSSTNGTNLPTDIYDEIDEAMHADGATAVGIATELMENSPYPEVRAARPQH